MIKKLMLVSGVGFILLGLYNMMSNSRVDQYQVSICLIGVALIAFWRLVHEAE